MNKDNQTPALKLDPILEAAAFLRRFDAHKGEERSRVSKLFRDRYYGRKACALACFMYNDFGLRSEPPLGSTFTREYSRIFYTTNGGPNSLAKNDVSTIRCRLCPKFCIIVLG